MKCLAVSVTALSVGIGMSGAGAATLQPTTVFEGAVPVVRTTGPAQSGEVSVQTWEIRGAKGLVQEIPLQGFYIAHLLSGAISTTIAGQTINQPPGAYWTVTTGATMQVRLLSESVVIETITVFK